MTTAKRSHLRKPERQDHDQQRAADHGDDGERDQHHRHGEPRGDDEVDSKVDAAAEVAGDETERRADQAGDQHHRQADQQRDARAVERAGEIVAAEVVGAERMRPRALLEPHRRDQPVVEVLRVGIVGGEQRRQQRHRHAEAEQHEAGNQAGMARHAPQHGGRPGQCRLGRQRRRRRCGRGDRAVHQATRMRGSRNALSRSAASVSST